MTSACTANTLPRLPPRGELPDYDQVRAATDRCNSGRQEDEPREQVLTNEPIRAPQEQLDSDLRARAMLVRKPHGEALKRAQTPLSRIPPQQEQSKRGNAGNNRESTNADECDPSRERPRECKQLRG